MTTKKMAIADSLENLSKDNFKKFCMALVDRRGERRVAFSKVEDKTYLEVTNVLVSTFTEDGAPALTSELLKLIGCSEEAKQLDNRISQKFPVTSSGEKAAAHQTGGAHATPSSTEEHFVDKHRLELIQRVVNINPILDVLLREQVVQDEVYDEISETPGNQSKMRKLYKLALKSGVGAKDVFLDSLKEYEPYLVADLQD
ncbi:apoptosis-associated speck-like protein containing a CARD isoform X1 [Syngnathoides biaculeatus]|uniref:apoptosis-associated speck-like protein containing a CARD isoform X1 n=1 Tax=Syngnathoides biaculeatus TaxID=300417 RepID=UPI002ADDC67E|nr:apoptosis-associated speck-like protein containing a CARD isoform X1 [Syngnathoides biaculeatus]